MSNSAWLWSKMWIFSLVYSSLPLEWTKHFSFELPSFCINFDVCIPVFEEDSRSFEFFDHFSSNFFGKYLLMEKQLERCVAVSSSVVVFQQIEPKFLFNLVVTIISDEIHLIKYHISTSGRILSQHFFLWFRFRWEKSSLHIPRAKVKRCTWICLQVAKYKLDSMIRNKYTLKWLSTTFQLQMSTLSRMTYHVGWIRNSIECQNISISS